MDDVSRVVGPGLGIRDWEITWPRDVAILIDSPIWDCKQIVQVFVRVEQDFRCCQARQSRKLLCGWGRTPCDSDGDCASSEQPSEQLRSFVYVILERGSFAFQGRSSPLYLPRQRKVNNTLYLSHSQKYLGTDRRVNDNLGFIDPIDHGTQHGFHGRFSLCLDHALIINERVPEAHNAHLLLTPLSLLAPRRKLHRCQVLSNLVHYACIYLPRNIEYIM